MSTRLLYRTFGVRTFDIVKTTYEKGATYFHLIKKPAHRRCVCCKSRAVGLDSARTYPLRSVPIGSKPVFMVITLYTLICINCSARRQESRDIADPRKSYTRAFARLVVELSSKMTIMDIARYLRVGWDLVKSIIADSLRRRARRRSWKGVRRIAIDEFAVRRGHTYMTLVVDLDSGRVLYWALGKDHTALEPFFRKLRRSGAQLEAIAVDMSGAYQKAIRLYAPPGVVVVHDRYHVVSLMNDVLDNIRNQEMKRLAGEGRRAIVGGRYLLLTASEKLEEQPDRKARLDQLLAANELLHKAYLLKEDLRLFWSCGSKQEAADFLRRWRAEARALKNRHMTRMAGTISRAIFAILAWYDHPISTGPLEGINNKVKVMKRVAYSYRDDEFFGLRLLFIHEAKFRLAGA
jgi:transposase